MESKEDASPEPQQNGGHTEDYQKLVDHGIDAKIAEELDGIYKDDILSHTDLDTRALDALKEFKPTDGVAVLKEFRESNLEHVSNKSAYLCGVMKTYRQKHKSGADTTTGSKKPGPDEGKLKEILERTGYPFDVTTGQRKYGGPPPDMEPKQPGAGHEVFCGKIPKEVFEDELILLFEKCGKLWDLRLMMDPMTGMNKGFCFVTFCDKVGAKEAVKLDGHEIKPGKKLKINISVANLKLFVGNIPKSKSKDQIKDEMEKLTDGLDEVIIYSSPDDAKKLNRGFAFLEYDSHKSASIAKRRLGNGRTQVWGREIIVDWAEPQEEPDEDTMSKVKVLYIRNIKADLTEETLKEKFEVFGKVERVKKIKDYGFVHYEEREHALKAMEELNGQKLGDSELEITLAKPANEKKKEKKQGRMQGQGFDDFSYGYPAGGGNRGFGGRGRGMRPSFGNNRGGGFRGGADFYDYGGYDDMTGAFDDYYEGGYDDYSYGGGYGGQASRGRGGRGGRGAQSAQSPRGYGGNMARGGRGAARGTRGIPTRGRGVGNRGMAQYGNVKRKAGGDHSQGMMKKRNTQGSWGSHPIAQQPLYQSGGYDDQWYDDSYSGQQW